MSLRQIAIVTQLPANLRRSQLEEQPHKNSRCWQGKLVTLCFFFYGFISKIRMSGLKLFLSSWLKTQKHKRVLGRTLCDVYLRAVALNRSTSCLRATDGWCLLSVKCCRSVCCTVFLHFIGQIDVFQIKPTPLLKPQSSTERRLRGVREATVKSIDRLIKDGLRFM